MIDHVCLGRIREEAIARIPEGTESIQSGAFRNQHLLQKLYVPDGVKWIGAHAFAECTVLEYAEIPSSVRTMDDQMFEGDEKLVILVSPGSDQEIFHTPSIHLAALLGYAEQEERYPFLMRKKYQEALETEKETCLFQTIRKSRFPAVNYFLRHELVDQKLSLRLLEEAEQKRELEITASLLDYRGRHPELFEEEDRWSR